MKFLPQPLIKQLCASRRLLFNIVRAQHFSPELATVPWAKIGSGKQRYMIVKIYVHGESGWGKDVVRGSPAAKNHASIYKKAQKEAKKRDLCSLPNGGGMLEHKKNKKLVLVWGKSKEYGKADKHLALEALQRQFPNYTVVIKKKSKHGKGGKKGKKGGKKGKKGDKKKK